MCVPYMCNMLDINTASFSNVHKRAFVYGIFLFFFCKVDLPHAQRIAALRNHIGADLKVPYTL